MALLTREQVLSPNDMDAGMAVDIPSVSAIPQLREIPDGRAGIAATLDQMVTLAHEAQFDYTFRRVADDILARIPGREYLAEAQAVQDWVRSNIRYTADPEFAEMVKRPIDTLQSRNGDCDDQSLLTAVIMRAIGYPARFKAVATQAIGQFEHVYAEAKIGRRWVALETTEDVPLGWEPQPIMSQMVRHI